jgi:hypothetical protein
MERFQSVYAQAGYIALIGKYTILQNIISNPKVVFLFRTGSSIYVAFRARVCLKALQTLLKTLNDGGFDQSSIQLQE